MVYKKWKFDKSKSARVVKTARRLLPKVKTRGELVEKLAQKYPCYKAESIQTILSRAHLRTGFKTGGRPVTPFANSTAKRLLTLVRKRPMTSRELEHHFKYSALLTAYRNLRMMGFPIMSTLILARGAGSCKSLIKHQFRVFFMERDSERAFALVEKTAGFEVPTRMKQSIGMSVNPREYRKTRNGRRKAQFPVRTSPNDEKVKELFEKLI